MITISYVDLLLTVLTACAVASTVALLSGVSRARSLAARLESLLLRLEPMLPEINRLSHEAEETLRSVRDLSQTADSIAHDVEHLTAETSRAATPLIQELAVEAEALRLALRHLAALVVGAKVGLAALAGGKS